MNNKEINLKVTLYEFQLISSLVTMACMGMTPVHASHLEGARELSIKLLAEQLGGKDAKP